MIRLKAALLALLMFFGCGCAANTSWLEMAVGQAKVECVEDAETKVCVVEGGSFSKELMAAFSQLGGAAIGFFTRAPVAMPNHTHEHEHTQ